MTLNHRDGALAWWKAGMSVVPVVADGSKRPLGSWKDYQSERAEAQRVDRWFKTAPEQGVGLICGKVSGGLEMLEIEANRMDSDSLSRVRLAMDGQNVLDLWDSLITEQGYCETTPSGGIHILYRIADQDVPGNTKIAMSQDNKQTFAETRGEGGFVVVAPSGGTVHKTGESWACIAGEVGTVPTITWEDRCKIHEALRVALDERVLPTYERPTGTQEYVGHGTRPGDAYNADPSVTVYDILTKNGWKYLGKMAGQDRYVHPMSSDMSTHSACTGYKGSENLYAWSGLPKEDFYDKFSLLAHLEFNGDFSAAGKYLAAQGYGDKSERLDISDWFADEGLTGKPVDAPEAPKKAKSLRVSEWTETGVGELLADVYSGHFRAVPEQKLWRYYSEGLWVRDMERRVEQAAKKVTKNLLLQAREMIQAAKDNDDDDELKIANGIYRKAESFRSDRGAKAVVSRFGAEKGITVPFTAFDSNVNLLRFTNGTFDLSTLELREHRPEDMITLDIPYAYTPEAARPVFDKFMTETIPDPEVRDYLRRAAGYTLSGNPSEGVWFALYGDTGCGKSTWLKIMTAALGEHARTAAQATFAQRNEGSRAANDLNDIRHARMVMISETKEGQLFNESLIKQYSGGDEMNSHGLYQENGTWRNKGVLFMATNHPPRLSADDNANWRRIKMIEFPVSQYNNPNMTPDPHLADKIIESELPGIMNWIIDGLRAYREFGLGEPKTITQAVRAHRTDVDPVAQFLNEGTIDGYIKVDPDAEITSPQLYKIFVNWCDDNGFKPFGAQRFGMRLTAMHFQVRRGGQGARLRVGIGVGSRGAFGTMG